MQQVLVTGAGPVGLTVAAELARFGLHVRIIDKSATPTKTSKALVLWSRTLELLDRAGCTDKFLESGLHAHGATIRTGTKVLGHADLGTIASPYNFALMLPQSDTERLLTEHLNALGVTVERNVELTSFSQDRQHVETQLRLPDGRTETLETSWLIGCDGAHSTVRKRLSFDFDGEAQGDDWMLADVRLEGQGAPQADEIAIFLHREGPFVIFPMPGGRSRIVTTTGKAVPGERKPDPTLAEVQALADQRSGGGFRVSDPAWLSNFRINGRKVSRYQQGRIFLAGDAAHVHSPAGGQGMNTGMQDAFNLAWKLALVARGTTTPALLESYTPERSAVGDMVVRNAARLTDMATLSNPAAQTFRNATMSFMLGFHAVQEKLAATLSETEIAYAKSPLSAGRHAGQRLPPAQYSGRPPGTGDKPRFIIYANDTQKAKSLAQSFPDLLEPAPRPSPDPDRLMIVRPDAYVGCIASQEDWAQAEKYLTNLSTLSPQM